MARESLIISENAEVLVYTRWLENGGDLKTLNPVLVDIIVPVQNSTNHSMTPHETKQIMLGCGTTEQGKQMIFAGSDILPGLELAYDLWDYDSCREGGMLEEWDEEPESVDFGFDVLFFNPKSMKIESVFTYSPLGVI